MPRLFVGTKDVQFVNDIVKELVKDVMGQRIYYYAISSKHTKTDSVYGEAVQKIFEKPIALNVMAGQPSWETKQDIFGREATAKVEILVQARDLLDKGLTLNEGDYFTYGDAVFEVVSYLNMNNIFGLEEYESAYKLIGKLARVGEFDPAKVFNPTKDDGTQETGIQVDFEQQRGLAEDSQHRQTGDVRQMRERLGDDMAPPALGEKPIKFTPDETGKNGKFSYDD